MAPQPLDWAAVRRDFPILAQEINNNPLIYFDNAATSQKPRVVIETIQAYYERDNSNVHRGVHELSNRATERYEAARQRAADFINAPEARQIIFTRGTTEGINLVAHSWGTANVKAKDRILLTEMEHHSNLVPWQALTQQVDAELAYLPVTGDEGALDWDRLDALLEPPTRLFAFTHISNSLATINPVKQMCERARQKGVVTVVDAAQSAGHLPLDVRDIGCDFLAFSGHKICGPTGIGVLYGNANLLEDMPPYQGGGEMIEEVSFFKTTFKEIPHKFEAGTPNIAGAAGLHAAMDYLDNLGRDRIFAHDRELANRAYRKLAKLPGIRLFGPRGDRAGLVSFTLQDVHSHDLVTLADQKGLAMRGGHHCNQPLMRRLGTEATSRASFYFYNTEAEVDRAVEIIRRIQNLLTGHGA